MNCYEFEINLVKKVDFKHQLWYTVSWLNLCTFDVFYCLLWQDFTLAKRGSESLLSCSVGKSETEEAFAKKITADSDK